MAVVCKVRDHKIIKLHICVSSILFWTDRLCIILLEKYNGRKEIISIVLEAVVRETIEAT